MAKFYSFLQCAELQPLVELRKRSQSRTTDRIKLDLDTPPCSNSRFDSLTAFSIAFKSSSEKRIGIDFVEFCLRVVTIRCSNSKDATV